MGMNQYWEAFEKASFKKTPLKWWWQRITRGYDDRDVWDLSDAIAAYVYPRLHHYVTWQKEHGMSCPEDLDPATWLEVLNKIDRAFKFMDERTRDEGVPPPPYEDKAAWDKWSDQIMKEDQEIKEGIVLFGKYLQDLWG